MSGTIVRFPLRLSGPGPDHPDPSSPVPVGTSPAEGAGTGPKGRRFLSLHLPRFAVERRLALLARRGRLLPEGAPFALLTEGSHGSVVHGANPAAE